MPKPGLDCLQGLPSTDALKTRFPFIDDPILLENIAITMQYVMFLLKLENNHSLPGSVEFIIIKDIIIHTGSIVESLLLYGLSKGVELKKFSLKDVGIVEEKYKDFKPLHKINENEIIGGVTRTTKLKEPKNAMMNDLIKAALRVKLIDDTLSLKLHEIKKDRNRLHLGSLSSIENSYTLEKVNDMFLTVKTLKESITVLVS